MDDNARLAAFFQFQDGLPAGQRVPVLRLPFPDGERAVWRSGAAALARHVRKHRPDALISFNSNGRDMLRYSGLAVPEQLGVACMNCLPQERGEILGTLGEQYAAPPILMAHLARKIRLREFGPSGHPAETSFRCPEHDGASLPQRDGRAGGRHDRGGARSAVAAGAVHRRPGTSLRRASAGADDGDR